MRKRRAVKRDVLADPIYKSKVVAKLINTIMLAQRKVNPNLDIIGNDVIYLGDTLEYTLQTASSWDFELGNKALTFVSSKAGKCKVKCSSDSKFIGEVVKLIAYDYGGNIIDKKEIRIGGMF